MLIAYDCDEKRFDLTFNEIDNPDGLEIDIKNLIITKNNINRLNPDIYKDAYNLLNLMQENSFDNQNNDNSKNETTKVKERISSPVRVFIEILLKEHYLECVTSSKPEKLANELNHLAEIHGYTGKEFNKSTISGWISNLKK